MTTLRNIAGRLARIESAREEEADAARAGMARLSDEDLHSSWRAWRPTRRFLTIPTNGA